MFLQPLLANNRRLLEAAVELHQAGEIPANSCVVDLDGLSQNARVSMDEARRRGLLLHAMTSHLGRAPGVLDSIGGVVDGQAAVDAACARSICANGHELGRVGHLVQVSRAESVEVAALGPDFWTVVSGNKVLDVSAAATASGARQKLLIQIAAGGGQSRAAWAGGVAVEDLPAMVDLIDALPAVTFAGVSTPPPAVTNPITGEHWGGTPVGELALVIDQAIRVLEPSVDAVEVSAPRASSSAVLRDLENAGVTQVALGHGLTGTTSAHVLGDLPEQPVALYLSEVAHVHHGTPLCFGGGFRFAPELRQYESTGLIAHDAGDLNTDPVAIEMPPVASIDYYARLHLRSPRTVVEGATVICGFQLPPFVTRARVVGVSGVGGGSPTVNGVWDGAGNDARRQTIDRWTS